MGCIYLILSYSGNGLVNIEFTKSFMKMKKRGIDNTIIKEYKTLNITKMNENQENQLKAYLKNTEAEDGYLINFNKISEIIYINKKTKEIRKLF